MKHFICRSMMALALALALAPARAHGQTNRFVIETSRYRAEFVGALMVSFKNKLIGGVEMLDAPSPDSSFTWLRMATPTGDDLNRRAMDTDSVVREGPDTVVTYRQSSPLKIYRLRISVDPGTEDLVLRRWATTSLPAIQRWWWLFPEQAAGRLLSPMWSGLCIPSQTPPDLQLNYAHATWNMGAPVLVYERNDHSGGFALWAHSGETYKQFNLGVFHVNWFGGGDRRTVSVEEFDWNRPASDESGVEFRMNAYAGNWSYCVAELKRGAFAPIDNDPPEWLKEIRLVYNIAHLRLPYASNRLADISNVMQRAQFTFPRAAQLRSRNVLLYHNDWSADGHDRNYPDYSLVPLPGDENPTTYLRFVAEAKASGYRIMPHFNSSHVARFQSVLEAPPAPIIGDHWAWQAFSNSVIQVWDGTKPILTGWMVDGTLGPESMYSVSLGNTLFRETLRNRILEVATVTEADAMYLDVSAGAWNAGDINPANTSGTGTNFASLRTLIADLRGSGLAVAGEMPCWQTMKAGQQMSTVFPTGLSDFNRYVSYACALSGCLLGEGHFFWSTPGSPDRSPTEFWNQHISGLFQGAVAGMLWPAVPYPTSETLFDHRGKVWANERALYALHHNVKLFTGASDLWSNDNVLIIEAVDGVNVPRTEQWLVKMLVCDWYWIYGGRAPTATEFNAATTNRHLADGSLLAELSAVVSTFTNNPTATNQIEPRGLALTKIHRLFPEYPVVDKLLRWADPTGEHIVMLPDDPSQPPVEVRSWFENPLVLTTNGLWFTLAGMAGSTNRIEYSTNLLSWWPRVDLVLTNGRAQFLDTSATNFGQRFYRAVAR